MKTSNLPSLPRDLPCGEEIQCFNHSNSEDRISAMFLESYILYTMFDGRLFAKLIHNDTEVELHYNVASICICGDKSLDISFALTSQFSFLWIRVNRDESDSQGQNCIKDFEFQITEIFLDINSPVMKVLLNEGNSREIPMINLHFCGHLNMIVIIISNDIFLLTLSHDIRKAQLQQSLGIDLIQTLNPLRLNSHHFPLFDNDVRKLIKLETSIARLNVWGTLIQQYIVCYGLGPWLLFLPLTFSQTGQCWEFQRVVDTEITCIENDELCPTHPAVGISHMDHAFHIDNKSHVAWITAISNNVDTYTASGDCQGNLFIWSMPDDPSELSALKPFIRADAFCEGSILTLHKLKSKHNDELWIGDSTGIIVSAEIVISIGVILKKRLVNIHTGTVPMEIEWSKSEANADDKGTLRSFDSDTGLIQSISLHDSIDIFFRAWPEPSVNFSSVEICCLLSAKGARGGRVSNAAAYTELLVTAGRGQGQVMFIWDLSSGKLISTLNIPHGQGGRRGGQGFITSLEHFFETEAESLDAMPSNAEGKTQSKVKLYSGHSDGSTNCFLITILSSNEHLNAGSASLDIHSQNLQQQQQQELSESIAMPLLDIFESSSGTNNNSPSSSSSIKSSLNGDSLHAGGVTGSSHGIVARDIECSISFSHDSLSTTNFCPLPVMKLFISSNGTHLAICYSLSLLVVYNCHERTAVLQVHFDSSIVDISRLNHYNSPDTDNLFIVLHGKSNFKVLDALSSKMSKSFDLGDLHSSDRDGDPIVCGCLWNSNSSCNLSLEDIKPVGLFIANGIKIFTYRHNHSLATDKSITRRLLLHSSTLNSLAGNYFSVDDLVLGVEAFDSYAGSSPMVAVWSLRRLVILRVEVLGDRMEYQRALEYRVPHEKIRIVFAKSLSLNIQIRKHRVVVLLSDGSTCVLHI